MLFLHQIWLKMDQIGPKVDPKGLEIVLLQENSFFAEILFAEHTLSEDIILNEVSLGGSPTINFALNDNMGIMMSLVSLLPIPGEMYGGGTKH